MQLLSTKKNKLLLLLPTCLVYVVYIILPILVSLYYSFTKYSGISKPRLYGLKNYIRLLDDPYFWIALKNTAIILGISILLLGIGAFFVAMLLNQPMRGVNVCKALIFAPATFTVAAWATTSFVTGLPGIAIQLVLLPTLVVALTKARLLRVRSA